MQDKESKKSVLEYVKDFDTWNTEKKKIENKKSSKDFYVLEREMWWCNLGVNIGHEQDGKGYNFERPAVILKMLSADTFLIVPTTSKFKDNKNYIKITTGEKYSYALLDQVKVIDKKRLSRKISTVKIEEYNKVLEGVSLLINRNILTNCESSLAGAFSEAKANCNISITENIVKSQAVKEKSDSKLILGIDPGYDRVGICVLKNENGKDELIYSECVMTDKKLADYERVKVVCDAIENIIQKYKPICAGLETLFVFKNQKTVMGVSEARGAIKYILNKNNIKIIELTPMQVKSSVCGDGHADKSQINYMVRNILKIDTNKKIVDDEIDAMAIALTAVLFNKNQGIL